MATLRPTDYSRITFDGLTVRKRGDTFRLRRELEAMEFVRRTTSVPVPRILKRHIEPQDDPNESTDADPRGGWFEMEKLAGTQMGAAWPLMSEHARSTTISQLRSHFKQLHSLRPEPESSCIGSCSYGPVYDHRLNNMVTCGPFGSVSEFHDFLVAPIKKCPRPELVAKYRDLFPDTHCINFIHADISWENILVDPDTGKVTGILDWEMAGFWPEWWEYRKALFGARSQTWWIQVLGEVMQAYPIETEADMEVEMF